MAIPKPTVHDLRHCWQTNSVRSGVHPAIADAILGHGDKKKSLQRLYLTISDDDLLDECLERGLGDGSYDRDYAARALEALLAGRVGEAVALLDRSLYPTRITKDQWTASLFPKGRQISAAT